MMPGRALKLLVLLTAALVMSGACDGKPRRGDRPRARNGPGPETSARAERSGPVGAADTAEDEAETMLPGTGEPSAQPGRDAPPEPRAAPPACVDFVTLGDVASERAHDLESKLSEVIEGGLGEPARRLLPYDPPETDGGTRD